MKVQEILFLLKELSPEVRRKYKAEIIGIFGSYARREQKMRSDLDVLVKFHKGASLFDFVGLAIFLEEKLKIKKVDIIPYDAIRPELKENILKEAVYL